MVATDHGGPNHSKVSHDHSYPELLESRKAVPDLVQFFGMELNTPGADHSSIIIPAGPDEADRLAAFNASSILDSSLRAGSRGNTSLASKRTSKDA
eukprot:gene13188-17534_t